MESPYQNDHQQLLLGFSSTPPPSFFNVGSNQFDHCNQNFILSDANGVLPISSRDQYPSLSYESPLPPLITPMVQDLGFHQWASNEEKSYMNHSAIQQLPLSTMFKEELSNSFPTTVSSSTDRLRLSSGELLFEAMRSLDNYSSILPTTNNFSSNPSTLNQISIDMDLQHLDLLASAKFSWILGQTSSINNTMASYPIPYFGLGHYEEPTQELSHCHHKVLSLVNGVTETKRANGILDHKASQAAVKAHRFEPPSSLSPFKVRKEKLGDRIASLQQLVAPFGKTDTASVLMEAIGYIKFLQDQVETLSVPYMRCSKKLRTVQGASSEENNECRHDLRSRGLCLVPLSCTSYVTNKDGGVWSLPKF